MNVIEKFIHRLEIVEKIATIEDYNVLDKVHYIVELTIHNGYKVWNNLDVNANAAYVTYMQMKYVLDNKQFSITVHILSSCRTSIFYHPFSRDELIACLELMKEKFNLKE
jgi:hypothetical protein